MSIPRFSTGVRGTNVRYNRSEDNKQLHEVPIPVSIGLYTVDNAIMKYMQTKIRPVVTQDGKQIQVPVIYGNPEKWKSVQQDGMIRDKNGKVQLPIIMIRRTNMKKNSINNPTNKYQSYTFKTGWNARNIYDKFTALNGIRPSVMFQNVTIPDFYDISYEAVIWTEYMEQMNRIVENISFESDEYWGEDNNYKFITRINQFDQVTDLPTNNDRIVRNKFTMNVRAYILPESALNKDGNRQSTTKLQYSPKKVVFDTELVLANGQVVKQTKGTTINPDDLVTNFESEDGTNITLEDGGYLLLEN